MQFKNGPGGVSQVHFKHMDPRLLEMVGTIDQVHLETVGRCAIVTSANDSVHRDGSAHYRGMAIDLRTRDLTDHQVETLGHELRDRLGPAWFILIEKTHIHAALRMNR